jgi:hypothetical protein
MSVSLLSVVCCQAEVSATGLSLVQRNPTECMSKFAVLACLFIYLSDYNLVEVETCRRNINDK